MRVLIMILLMVFLMPACTKNKGETNSTDYLITADTNSMVIITGCPCDHRLIDSDTSFLQILERNRY